MKAKKRILSAFLAIAMIASLVISGSAQTQETNIIVVEPEAIASEQAWLIGQRTELPIASVTNGAAFKVAFSVYMDPETFHAFASGTFVHPVYDTSILEQTSLRPQIRVSGVENINYEASPFSQSFTVTYGRSAIPENSLESNGYALDFVYEFKIKDAEAFLALNPNVGLSISMGVALDNIGDLDFLGYWKADGASKPFGAEVWDVELAPAVVTFSGPKVEYTIGKGERANDMDAFDPFVALPGTYFVPADGTGLAISAEDSSDDIAKIFDFWKDGLGNEYHPGDGKKVPMLTTGVVLTAIYADDADGDGIADYKELKVTYTLRSGDEGTIKVPATETDNGFFATEGSNKVIFVEENEAIGDSIATVDLDDAGLEDWEFVGYFIGEDEYTVAELAALEITAPTVIELRTMLDTNGNGIDDRTNVTIDFLAPDGTTIKSMEVPDGTPYIIYEDPAKENEASSGEAGENGDDPTEVTLPDVPATIPSGKHTGWEIEPVLDAEDKVIGIIAVPIYSEAQEVTIPDVITDPETDEDPEDFVTDMDTGSTIVHNDINGDPIMETEVGSSEEMQVIDHPTPGAPEYPTLPKRDEDGNPFVGWVLSGPEEGDEGEDVYTLDPYYAKPIEVTVTDPKSDETTEDDEPLPGFDGKEIPSDSTYEILDENGDVKESGKIVDKDGEITLPATEDMPVRNDDGDVFTGEWIVTEEVDDEDGSTNFVFAPEYREPTEDDIVIEVDADTLAEGNGMGILKGFYADEITETAYFYLNIGGVAAIASDADRLSVNVVPVFGFEDLRNPGVVIGEATAPEYDGVKTINDVEYGVFEVTYTTVKSSIIQLNLKYGDTEIDTLSHLVITVGDSTVDGKINSSDVARLKRVINKDETEPEKGIAGNYHYELLDADKNGKVNSADASCIGRMVNNEIEPN